MRDPKRYFPNPIQLSAVVEGALLLHDLGEGFEAVVSLEGGKLRVLRDRCPHMGSSLSQGKLVDGCLQCPWHGYRFERESGRLVENPNVERFASLRGLYASFKPEKAPEYRAQVLEFELEGDRAWVRRPGAE